MGSAHAPPPIDFRIERVQKVFGIPDQQLVKLWHIFLTYDRDKKGVMMIQDFFELLIKYPRSPLTDNLLGLIGTKSEGSLDYGEFVELVSTFCCFEEMELLKYFFYILDPHRIGRVEINELKHILISIHSDRGLIREALEYINERTDGEVQSFNFDDVCVLKSKYPYAFYPLFQLQTHMLQYTLGERRWENHKVQRNDAKEESRRKELAKLEKDRKDSEKEKESATEEVVKKRMGVKYWLMPWQRAAEHRKLAKIAVIESELEQQGGRRN